MTPAELRDLIAAKAIEIAKKSSSPSVDQWAAEIQVLADQIVTVAPQIIERRMGERRDVNHPDPIGTGDRRLIRRVVP